jgi:hypothetical protein
MATRPRRVQESVILEDSFGLKANPSEMPLAEPIPSILSKSGPKSKLLLKSLCSQASSGEQKRISEN